MRVLNSAGLLAPVDGGRRSGIAARGMEGGTCEQRSPEEKQMAERRKMQKIVKHKKKYENHYYSLNRIIQKSAISMYELNFITLHCTHRNLHAQFYITSSPYFFSKRNKSVKNSLARYITLNIDECSLQQGNACSQKQPQALWNINN